MSHIIKHRNPHCMWCSRACIRICVPHACDMPHTRTHPHHDDIRHHIVHVQYELEHVEDKLRGARGRFVVILEIIPPVHPALQEQLQAVRARRQLICVRVQRLHALRWRSRVLPVWRDLGACAPPRHQV